MNNYCGAIPFCERGEHLLYEKNLRHLQRARQDILNYIVLLYNPKRKHGNNGMLSPIDFERQQYLELQEV